MTAVASPSSIHPVTVRRGHAERRTASPQGAGGGVGGNSVAQILQDHCPDLALYAGMVIEQLDSQVGTWQFSTDGGRTWRTVRTDLINRAGSLGLALDRVGFTVEDRDRSRGLYFVRYVDPDADNRSKKDTGLMSKLAFWKSDTPVNGNAQYRIYVSEDGQQSVVKVLSAEGGTDKSETAKKILGLLLQQLQ